MRVGRKSKLDKPIDWKISIPQSLVVEVEMRLLDPVTLKTRYGARSKLVVRLLQEWVDGQKGDIV